MTKHAERREGEDRRAVIRRRVTDLEERYRQLVELAPDGILIHDGERIVLANAAAVRLAGATHPDELVGLTIDTFLSPPHLKAVQTQLISFGDLTPLAPPVRDTFRRLDGSSIEVEVTAIAFTGQGHLSVHLVVRDITERLAMEDAARRTEEHLQHAQRMEAVGALAGGVAHEVNNMMSVILGFSRFLLRDAAIPEGRLSEVQQIVKAAERTATVTRQLLAFSRRAFHQPQVVDLEAAMHDLEPIVRRLLGEGRQLAMVSDGSPRVWVDKGQLEQVIVNLALNARDAMPTGGTLTITTTESELPNGIASADGVAIPAGRYALLIVRDTGSGMDATTQSHIFEPFFTTKPVGQGTGLGLAATYGIIKQNRGYIGVATAPERGAAFTLYLPVLSGAEVVDPGTERVAVRRGDAAQAGSTVLLVEDDAAVRAIAAQSLEDGGFRVLQAFDGANALDMVDRYGPPDLVLTDLIMPVIGGAELARHLRQRWPALPVLFMSGYSVDDLRQQGAVGVEPVTIQKPFTPDGLVRNVSAALAHVERSQALSE